MSEPKMPIKEIPSVVKSGSSTDCAKIVFHLDREEDMVVWLNENKLELGDVLDDFLDDIPSDDFFKYGHANMYGYQKNTISTKDYIDDLKRAYCLLKQLSSFEEDFSTDYLSKLMRLSVFYRAPLRMLESLREKGADVWLKDKEGKSLLFYATKGYAKRLNYQALHYLIKLGLDVGEVAHDGTNVLHWIYDSIFTCDYVENLKGTVDEMLELGADVNAEDSDGRTPLATLDKTCKILYHSHLVKAVALLLARDAYVNPKNLRKIRQVPLYHSYFRRCEEELASLKQTKVHDNFSYFDVLAKGDYSLALCLRNRDVSGKLYKALKYDYPDIQYSNSLWRKYDRAIKLTDRLEKTCSLLSDILIPYCVPIEIVEKITFHCTQCLTDQDFDKLFDEKSSLELTDG